MSVAETSLMRALGQGIEGLGQIWYRLDRPEISLPCKEAGLAVPAEAYVAARVAPMGSTPIEALSSLFGFLPIVLVEGAIRTAREKVDFAVFARQYQDGVSLFADYCWAERPETSFLAEVLRIAVERADFDGRPLAAACKAVPSPLSIAGQLAWAANVLREHRFAGHVFAVTGAGLSGPAALVLSQMWGGLSPFGHPLMSFWEVDPNRIFQELAAGGYIENGLLTKRGIQVQEDIDLLVDAFSASAWKGISAREAEHVVAALGQLSARGEGMPQPV